MACLRGSRDPKYPQCYAMDTKFYSRLESQHGTAVVSCFTKVSLAEFCCFVLQIVAKSILYLQHNSYDCITFHMWLGSPLQLLCVAMVNETVHRYRLCLAVDFF